MYITRNKDGDLVLHQYKPTKDSGPLSFPTKEMAAEFLNCFRDLCETAKILL